MTRYGIIMDEEYNNSHKRTRLTLWSGPFASVLEGEALSLPKNDGFMVTTYNGDKVRVTCPVERTDKNYQEQDKAFNDALNAHYGEAEPLQSISLVRDGEPGPVKPFVHNGKRILNRR